jgi:hypothetical protein
LKKGRLPLEQRHLSSAAGIQEALTKPVVPAQGWLRRDTIIIGGGAINRGVETGRAGI